MRATVLKIKVCCLLLCYRTVEQADGEFQTGEAQLRARRVSPLNLLRIRTVSAINLDEDRYCVHRGTIGRSWAFPSPLSPNRHGLSRIPGRKVGRGAKSGGRVDTPTPPTPTTTLNLAAAADEKKPTTGAAATRVRRVCVRGRTQSSERGGE